MALQCTKYSCCDSKGGGGGQNAIGDPTFMCMHGHPKKCNIEDLEGILKNRLLNARAKSTIAPDQDPTLTDMRQLLPLILPRTPHGLALTTTGHGESK